MNIQTFVQKYGHTIDDGWLSDGKKDGVIIAQDIAAAVKQGVFDHDPGAAQFAYDFMAAPNPQDVQAFWNYRSMMQTPTAGGNTYSAPELAAPRTPKAADSTTDGQLMDRISRQVTNREDWKTYTLTSANAENKKIATNAIISATSNTTLQSLLAVHINMESDTYLGDLNGGWGNIPEGSYWVTPYNLCVDMVRKVCADTASRGDPYGLGGIFGDLSNVSYENIVAACKDPSKSAAIGARVMLASIDAHGWLATEGFVRSGRTGFDAIKALEGGHITEDQAAQRWAQAGGYHTADMKIWLNGLAAGTKLFLLEQGKPGGGAFSASERMVPVDPQKIHQILTA